MAFHGSGGCVLRTSNYLHPATRRDICPRNIMVEDTKRAGSHSRGSPTESAPLHVVLIDVGSAGPARLEIRSRSDVLRIAETAAAQSSAPYRAPELWSPPGEGFITEAADGECSIGRIVLSADGMSMTRFRFKTCTIVHVARLRSLMDHAPHLTVPFQCGRSAQRYSLFDSASRPSRACEAPTVDSESLSLRTFVASLRLSFRRLQRRQGHSENCSPPCCR